MKSTLNAIEYSIDTLLRSFFNDPRMLRCLQGTWNGLIGADLAFSFFARSKNIAMELALYIEIGVLPELAKFLCAEGYMKSSHSESDNGINHITYVKGGKEVREVRLIGATKQPPILLALLHSSTTAGLTFIAWNEAYALFPYSSFVEK
jgi:hypothetical protein